ncbi:hypothetical protein NP493_204g10028 [Ridgeia piscesae]|uniref:Uncharacterized protein n=1 Tax=Ridgeia piscesae TaxID=27915 RepID=A0AAD9UE69_RIDPI|nr:hypothetical protein NP493_204g10028 [Ridgeia piscesae]
MSHITCALLIGAVLSQAVAEEVIDIMEPCRFPVPMGVEQEYIPDKSLWATSWINYKRQAKYGRLNGWKGECQTIVYLVPVTCQEAVSHGMCCHH